MRITRITGAEGIVGAVALAVAMTAVGCSHKETAGDTSGSRALYEEVCKLTKSYTDSVAKCRSAGQLDTLHMHYSEALEAVNMRAVPDADFFISEGENDTVAMLMAAFDRARRQRLADLRSQSGEDVQTVDTVISQASQLKPNAN